MDSFIVTVTLLLFLVYQGKSEVFTAVSHMEGLVNIEKDLLSGLNSYINSEKERYQVLLKA